MAFSAARSLANISLRLTRGVKHGLGTGGALSPHCGQIERGFTRSLWYLSSQTKPLSHQSDGIKALPLTKMCGCCGLHTVGDKEMAEFLSGEIENEKKNDKSAGKLPQFSSFEVSKTDGAEITLSRKSDAEDVEKVTVRFNVNDSVEDEQPSEEFDESQPVQEPPAEDEEMVSRPAFTVEINKGSGATLALHCMINPPEPEVPGEEGYEDLIQITEVAVLKDGEWKDETYTMAGTIMDGNLYDMLLKMLEERGVDGDFVHDLVEFSTVFEQKKYINLLEELKDFISCSK